ncbi:MAG TPA: M48 family metallopeptidase [Chloroflexota bacterium]|nr:M48 family metallopeptidase [Chloroflexota bacterium]
MAPDEPVLDPARQRLAKTYAKQKRALMFAGVFLALAYLVGWQVGLSLAGLHVFGAAAIIALFVGIVAGWEIVSLPNDWIGYQLSRGYGLSTQTVRSWFADKLKALALLIVIGGAMVELTYLFMRLQPAWWWLIDAGVLLLFTVILANLAPVLIAPLFFKFTPLDDPELTQRLVELARNAGAKVRGVFTMHLSAKTTAANAALMGWGNTRRIVVGDTLTHNFTHDETEAVLAHELGHHVHRDIWRAIALQSLTTVAALWLTDICFLVLQAHGFDELQDAQNMPVIGLLFGFWTAVFTPLTNWASRVAERRADAYALRMATRPRAFVASMIRLANQNLAEVDPPRWVELLLHDHPAIKRRIELFEQ